MGQPQFILDVDDVQVENALQGALNNIDDLSPAMEVIGELGVASIQKNFEVGGRPQKWEALAESTVAHRIKMNKWPGQILINKGELKQITYDAGKREVTLNPADVPYAAIQHFGGKAGRGRKVKIPAREYMVLQDEDGVEIQAVLADHVLGN